MDGPKIRNVLLVDPDPGVRQTFVRSFAEQLPDVATTVVTTLSEATSELSRSGYDAVLLRVDGPQEMTLILRIKATAPSTPVFALVPETNPDLDDLARRSGADGVLRAREGRGEVLAEMIGTLDSAELIHRSRVAMEETRALRKKMLELIDRGKPLREHSYNLAGIPVQEFVPLLIEDDSDQAFFLERCFKKVKLPFPLPVLRDGEEAIAYLAGRGKFGDRSAHPLPTLLISDLQLPKKSGFDVLAWVRSQPEFEKLVVFILTSSQKQDDHDRAMVLGADAYFEKPILAAASWRSSKSWR